MANHGYTLTETQQPSRCALILLDLDIGIRINEHGSHTRKGEQLHLIEPRPLWWLQNYGLIPNDNNVSRRRVDGKIYRPSATKC